MSILLHQKNETSGRRGGAGGLSPPEFLVVKKKECAIKYIGGN